VGPDGVGYWWVVPIGCGTAEAVCSRASTTRPAGSCFEYERVGWFVPADAAWMQGAKHDAASELRRPTGTNEEWRKKTVRCCVRPLAGLLVHEVGLGVAVGCALRLWCVCLFVRGFFIVYFCLVFFIRT